MRIRAVKNKDKIVDSAEKSPYPKEKDIEEIFDKKYIK